jgi:hypothetical protein
MQSWWIEMFGQFCHIAMQKNGAERIRQHYEAEI